MSKEEIECMISEDEKYKAEDEAAMVHAPLLRTVSSKDVRGKIG